MELSPTQLKTDSLGLGVTGLDLGDLDTVLAQGDTEENSGAQTEGAADLSGVLRELESRELLPGFFSSWSFRDTVSVPALVIDWGTLELLRFWFLGVPFAGLALLLALIPKLTILLSLAEDLSADWRARQVRFALAVHRRREALRTVLYPAAAPADVC